MADDADWIRVRVSVYDRRRRQRWRTLCRGRRRGAAGDVDDRLTKLCFFFRSFVHFFVFFLLLSFLFFNWVTIGCRFACLLGLI